MKFNLEDFCNDLGTLELGALKDKYWKKLPKELTRFEVLKCAKHTGLDRFVRQQWKDDGHDADGLYFIKTGCGYEVFYGERGGKHGKEAFPNVDQGFSGWLAEIFNELGNWEGISK